MCVLGGVFVDKAIIQPLTDYIWLGGDPFDSTRQVFVARLFTALKSAIKSLEKYYQALALGLPCSNVRRLPLITEYGPDQTKFTYSSRLAPENKYRLLYPAALDDVPNSPMIVKFVQRYNADAHRLLAAQGLAPKLHYSSTDDNVRYGKRFMIVMDYIDLKVASLSNNVNVSRMRLISFIQTSWYLVISGDPTSLLEMIPLCSSTLIGVESQAKLATLLKSIVIQVWAGPRCGTRLPYCLDYSVYQNLH